MQSRFFVVAGLMLVFATGAGAQTTDPAAVTPAPESAAPPSALPATPVTPPPAQVVPERPKPAEKPRPAVKPRAATGEITPPEVVPAPVQPVEPPPVVVPAPAKPMEGAPAPAGEANSGYGFGCVVLAFAMLIIGFAAGFIARHYWSRHKLGGMTVRIGTWRGVP